MAETAHGTSTSVNRPYRQKLVRRGADLEIGDSWLKWYEISRPEVDLASESADCRAVLLALVGTGELDLRGSVGFVEVHHCDEVVFLIVMSWTNENELWQSTWVRELDGDTGYVRVTEQHKGHRPMLCVWELMPVSHERDAWVGYLRSAGTAADLAAYRASTFEGMC